MLKPLIPAVLLLGAGLACAQNALTECEKKEGFSLLYDGTLASFKDNFVNYVKNGTNTTILSSEWAVNPATGAIGIQGNTEDIRSKKVYRDFDLRVTFRCDANQGIFYRHRLTGDRAWQTGIEYAINNYTNQNKDAPGAAYDLIPPEPNAYQLHATGRWNEARIVVKGDSSEHWMNGAKVVGFRYHSDAFWTAFAVSKWNASQMVTYNVPGNKAAGYITEGHIGFQGDHGGKWEIRNLRISENPYHGPVHADAACATAVRDEGLPGGVRLAVLRRDGAGLRLDFGGAGVSGATLISLAGRAWRGRISGAAAVFPGSFHGGVYLARLQTPQGEIHRRFSLP